MAENREQTAKRRRGPGRPFPPGNCANPGGRPKVPDDVKEALEAGCPRAVQRLLQLVESDDEQVALKASTTVIERKLGKPTQALEHSGPGGKPMSVVFQINGITRGDK